MEFSLINKHNCCIEQDYLHFFASNVDEISSSFTCRDEIICNNMIKASIFLCLFLLLVSLELFFIGKKIYPNRYTYLH